ncbi:PPOX class F420-dependent oxidoreductase [Amycolatopsis granulosa]|uniref:PPOX class F420-dependent oxidoreductase n=1 Tax=Amycolatopsis granulosa TaxID=185684 RepID=UPI0014215EFA|nr:PPOX class F420-dependent oxidoreductase [Amycolatopsis granulosa]NIH86229.1 pyridoxamine 5'-phosphate oxidase family protein [Amycolatopsis granulosa]
MIFTERERAYLRSQPLGRMGTVDVKGRPQVRPLGFEFNDDGTIDIGGPNLSSSQKWRNIERNPEVSFVVDDLTPNEPGAVKPGWGRGIEIRGTAELLTGVEPPAYGGPSFSNELIRIHPRVVHAWHLDPDQLVRRAQVSA